MWINKDSGQVDLVKEERMEAGLRYKGIWKEGNGQERQAFYSMILKI